MADIKGLSKVCKQENIPLICDNAHGAYLKFLSLHPIQLGADMCCDSAHKTLPVLTGGAYLHINNADFLSCAKDALCLFGSTSPSYLILNSLDLANKYMYEKMEKDVLNCAKLVDELKVYITNISTEPLKITIDANKMGYTGFYIADILRKNGIECEYADNQFVVLMFSVCNDEKDFEQIKNALKSIKIKEEIKEKPIEFPKFHQETSIKNAIFSLQEEIDIENAVDRICGFCNVSCPPAIPIAVSGERITNEHIKLFKKYNIKKIKVIAK